MKTQFKLDKSMNLTVMTGAGVSAESGIKTFRDNGGLWEQHRIEDVATPEAFVKDPKLVWKFYKKRYFDALKTKPNSGHLAIKKLAFFLNGSGEFNLITQNVDGLHYVAGNEKVIEMHGTFKKCFCVGCNKKIDMKNVDLSMDIPICNECGNYLRPDIVWFGEMPYEMDKIQNILMKTDVLLVIGTSGVVYPAAQFLAIAKSMGAFTIGVNLDKPENLRYIDEFHQGRSGELLPKLLHEWQIN